MAALPDELWRRILEIGVQSGGFSYKDLCCLSISCRRLRRLSDEDSLWSPLIASDFPPSSSSSSSSSSSITATTPRSSSTSKSLYKLRFEKDRDKRIAAHRRVVLRKESQVLERCRKIREMETQLVDETRKMRATVAELSSLSKVRQASIALNVWQPEVIRGRQKQMVEQSVVPVESRFHALEMELKLCQQQILGLEKAHRDEKRRLAMLEEELQSIRYHPLRVQEPTKCTDVGFKTKSKKLKRFHCEGEKTVDRILLS